MSHVRPTGGTQAGIRVGQEPEKPPPLPAPEGELRGGRSRRRGPGPRECRDRVPSALRLRWGPRSPVPCAERPGRRRMRGRGPGPPPHPAPAPPPAPRPLLGSAASFRSVRRTPGSSSVSRSGSGADSPVPARTLLRARALSGSGVAGGAPLLLRSLGAQGRGGRGGLSQPAARDPQARPPRLPEPGPTLPQPRPAAHATTARPGAPGRPRAAGGRRASQRCEDRRTSVRNDRQTGGSRGGQT